MFVTSLIFTAPVSISPIPQDGKVLETFSALTNVTIDCMYADKKKCAQHIIDNFNYYNSIQYPRDRPYSVSQYNQKGMMDVIEKVYVVIDSDVEKFDILTLNETYSMVVNNTGVYIQAANSFAFARALASMIQLVYHHPVAAEDRGVYVMYHCQIVKDFPAFPWRQLLIDTSRHFLPVSVIKHQLDALSISKTNVLHLHTSDAESYPIKFVGSPQNNLVKGAWAPYFYLTVDDLHDLQDYAFVRGIILYAETDLPGHVYAMHSADENLIAHCGSAADEVGTPINPIYILTETYVAGLVEETLNATFLFDKRYTPMIHLGGDEVNHGCWNGDPAIKQYMDDNKIDTHELWRRFHQNVSNIVDKIVGSVPHYRVYWEESFSNGNNFDKNSIVHYWMSENKRPAISTGHRVLQSTSWYLDQMHPGGSNFYFYQDTYQAFYKVDIVKGLNEEEKKLVLGGGAAQWGECVWGHSMDAHIYPRALAVSEVLWSNPAQRDITDQVIKRLEHLSCKLVQAGVKSGGLDPEKPCFGMQK